MDKYKGALSGKIKKGFGKQRRKENRKSNTVLPTAVWTSDVGVNHFNTTTCSICGGIEDEDLIILGDGPGCANEIHMYCLTPIMTTVPDGDWFCEACDSLGTTLALQNYFKDKRERSESVWKLSSTYDEYLTFLQQGQVPIHKWKPTASATLIPNEFDVSSINLIGCIVRLNLGDSCYHSGRIINRRMNPERARWNIIRTFEAL